MRKRETTKENVFSQEKDIAAKPNSSLVKVKFVQKNAGKSQMCPNWYLFGGSPRTLRRSTYKDCYANPALSGRDRRPWRRILHLGTNL